MSEFGKGLCYCIGLFLAHAEREVKTERDAGLWFNAASDHLIELQVEDAPKSVRNRLKEFAEKCLNFGHGSDMYEATKKDVSWAVEEAKELLRLIDME